MTIRCVVFDAVGTLLRPCRPVAETYHDAGKKNGSRLAVVDVARKFAAAFRDISQARPDHRTSESLERQFWADVIATIFRDVDEKAQADIFDQLWSFYGLPTAWQLFDDVIPACHRIRDLGIRIAIGSNFDSRLHSVCDGLFESDLVDGVFDSGAIGFRKPAEDFFRQIQRAIGLSSDELLMVGDDRELDVDAAIRCGWHARQILRTGDSTELSVNSLLQITDLLAK